MHGADAVRGEIVEAWRDAMYPGDDRICSPTYDDEGVGAYFRGRGWEGHDVASLRYHSVGLSFFTPEAFGYYLAAYMLAVLDDAIGADVVYDSLKFHLSPTQLGMQWADTYLARLACLSARQRAATVSYLAWCNAGDDFHDAAIDETIDYLRTGTVRTAASPVARVLQLAGDADRAPAEIERLLLGNTSVTDADLVGLCALPALRELDLGGCTITDAGLASVAEVTALVELDLSNCRSLSAAGLAHLASLPHLAELELANVDVDDDALRALAPARLRGLDLTHARRITDAGWSALDVARLERLDMFGVDATDMLLSKLGGAAALKHLNAKTFSDAGLRALARAPLVELAIGDASHAIAAGLAALAQISTLHELSMHGLAVERWPAGWPALERLTLLGGTLGRSFAGVGELPALRELVIHATRVEPGALATIARAPRLAELTIWCSHTAIALDELAGANALHVLKLHDATVTGLATLARLPMLTTLGLDRVTPIDDAALRALAMSALQEIELSDIPIDDAGLDLLGASARLCRLRLSNANVAGPAIDAFRRAHPAITIYAV